MIPWRRIAWIGGALAVLAAGVGVALAVRAGQRREFVAASVPALPVEAAPGPRLAPRLRAVDTRARAGDVTALAELAALYHANGLYAEARSCYEALRALEPGEARWPHRQASLQAVFGELTEAIALWREAVRLAPDYVPARVRLGEALLKADQPGDAVTVLQAALQRSPDNDYATHALARIAVAQGQWREARGYLEPLVVRSPFGLGTDLLATVYENLGETARAAEARGRQKAHGLYVAVPDPWIEALNDDCYDPFRLAVESGTADLRGDADLAARWLNRAIELAPADGALRLQAGVFYEKRKRLDVARQHLERGVAAEPAFSDLWVRLVVVLEAMGDQPAAQRALSEGLASNPGSGALLIERARRFKTAGQLDRAEADLRRAVALRHDDAVPHVELASLLFARNRVEEGVGLLQQALVAEPDNPTALSTLMFVAITQRDRAEADRWWQRTLRQPRLESRTRERLVTAYREAFAANPP